MNILFMCVANSARSQLAEGLAKEMLSGVAVASAGSEPSKVNPIAVKVMQEIDIDIKNFYSKSYEELNPGFIATLDYVITLCAEEVCPNMASRAKKLHWPLTDPAKNEGSEESQLNRFREARTALINKIISFAKEKGIALKDGKKGMNSK